MKNHIYFIVSDDLGADTAVIFFDTDKDSLEFAQDKAKGIIKKICKNSGWTFDQSIKYQLISLADLSYYNGIEKQEEADALLKKVANAIAAGTTNNVEMAEFVQEFLDNYMWYLQDNNYKH